MAHVTLWNAGTKETIASESAHNGGSKVFLVVSISRNGIRLYRVYISRTKTNTVYFMYGTDKKRASRAFDTFVKAISV